MHAMVQWERIKQLHGHAKHHQGYCTYGVASLSPCTSCCTHRRHTSSVLTYMFGDPCGHTHQSHRQSLSTAGVDTRVALLLDRRLRHHNALLPSAAVASHTRPWTSLVTCQCMCQCTATSPERIVHANAIDCLERPQPQVASSTAPLVPPQVPPTEATAPICLQVTWRAPCTKANLIHSRNP